MLLQVAGCEAHTSGLNQRVLHSLRFDAQAARVKRLCLCQLPQLQEHNADGHQRRGSHDLVLTSSLDEDSDLMRFLMLRQGQFFLQLELSLHQRVNGVVLHREIATVSVLCLTRSDKPQSTAQCRQHFAVCPLRDS